MLRSVYERVRDTLKRKVLGIGSKITESTVARSECLGLNVYVVEAYGLKTTQETCCCNQECNQGIIRCLGSLEQNAEIGTVIHHSEPQPQSFVGLKNLGNTCYVAVALQVLFNNTQFMNELKSANNDMPLLIAINSLFDAMASDPPRADDQFQKLLKAFNRQGNPQGDPTEFVMSLLTGYRHKTNEEYQLLQQICERTFIMEQINFFRCLSCENTIQRQENLLFLSAKVTNVESTLTNLLLREYQPEIVEDYECPSCLGKQVSLQKGLITLPPTIFVQIEKCIFDRSFKSSERSDTCIFLPATMDFNLLMVEAFKNPDSLPYTLQAVVHHHGQSTNDGHYTVDIQDQRTGRWKNFNDDTVTDCDEASLRNVGSNTACWAVYSAVPISLLESEKPKVKEEDLVKIERAESFLSGDLLSFAWLKAYNNERQYTEIDNTNIICKHGKANPLSANEMRAISKSSADKLYSIFGGGPRLQLPACLCVDCSFIKTLEQDYTQFRNIVKTNKKSSDKSFWIERNLTWRWPKAVIAMGAVDKGEEADELAPKKMRRDLINEPGIGQNAGVLCPHGNLTPNKLKSQLIPLEAWQIVKKYLPEAKEVENCKFHACTKCKSNEKIEELRMKATNLMEHEAAISQSPSFTIASTSSLRLPVIPYAASSSAKRSLFKGLESSSPLFTAGGNVSYKSLAAAITPKSSFKEGQGEEQTPHPAGIILCRAGYYTIPSLPELAKLYEKTGKCAVPNFFIGRLNYGNIFFDGPIDVAGLNLDKIVHIRHREVVVYPNDQEKPSLGQGLNRKAQVTLDQIYPTNKQTGAPIRDVDTILNMDYDTTLRKACIKMKAHFIEYLPNNGTLVFKVDHFSKYGLPDETYKENDVMVVSEPPVVQATQQPAVPPKPTHTLSDLHTIYSTSMSCTNIKGTEEDFAEILSLGEQMPRLTGMDTSKIRLMKASLFENEDSYQEEKMVEDEFIFKKPASPKFGRDLAAVPRELKLETTFAVPKKEAHPSRPHQRPAIVTLKLMPFPALLPNKMDNGASNSALFQGKCAKTSWTVRGALVAICDQLVSVTCPYLASDIKKELLEERLCVQLRLTEFNPKDGLIPKCTPREGGDFFVSHSDVVKSKSPSSVKERMAHQVLLLCHTLWGDLNSGSTSTPAIESHLRRQAVCKWLQSVICEEEASSPTPASTHEAKVLKQLAQGKLLECVDACQEAGEHFLSLLVVSSGSAVYLKQMVLKQVHDCVSTGVSQQLSEDRLRAWLLFGASQPLLTQEDGVTLNALQYLPWLSALAAHAWYLFSPAASVPDVLAKYKSALMEQSYFAVAPVPPGGSEVKLDLRYQLLKLFAQRTYPLERILSVETHYPESPLDFSLSFVEMAFYHLYAEERNECYQTVINQISADAVTNDDFKSVWELLRELQKHPHEIDEWQEHSQINLNFLNLVDELSAMRFTSAEGKLDAISQKVVAALNHLRLMPCSSPKERLCQSEMAFNLSELARAIIIWRNETSA